VIILFVHPAANTQHDQHIGSREQVEPHSGNGGLDDDLAEVADEQVYRVEQKQVLHQGAVAVDVVENGGHVHQKLGKDRPQVLNVPEKDEQSRQDQSNANVEQHQTADGVQQQNKLPRERDVVQHAEQEKHAQGQPKVNEGLHVLGQQEQVLGHVNFCENARIAHEGGHTLTGGLVEVGEYQIATEQIGGVVGHIPAKKLREDQPHDQQSQQRGQHAPGHAQNRALVFLFEITLDQFLEEEAVLKQFLEHRRYLYLSSSRIFS